MKGLLRNNFYSMSSNLQLAFGIAFIGAFVPLITGEKNMFTVTLVLQSLTFIGNIGAALNTDLTSKWSKFEITLPVARKNIIQAKYISFILLIICGIFMCALTTVITSYAFGSLGVNTIITGFTLGISLSLITSSLMYPIILNIGTEKNELILFICSAIAVALFLIVSKIATPFVSDSFIIGGKSQIGIVFTLISIMIYILSYFVSLSIYKEKEL